MSQRRRWAGLPSGRLRTSAVASRVQRISIARDPRLGAEARTDAYVADVNRRIEREQKRIERAKAKAAKDAQRAATSAR